MPVVTGTLTDIGGGHLVGKQPEMIFTLNSPNRNGTVIFPTEPARTTPDSSGAFSLVLGVTTKMVDDAWYSLTIRWLDSAGNYVRVDFPDWKIRVNTEGGILTFGIDNTPTNTRMVYVSLTAPPDPRPFTLWLKQNPDNPASPSSTGDIYEWRNV